MLLEHGSNISIDDVTVQYNAGIKNYQPLVTTGSSCVSFSEAVADHEPSANVNGNADYKPLKLDDVKVNMEDHRTPPARSVLKSGASMPTTWTPCHAAGDL